MRLGGIVLIFLGCIGVLNVAVTEASAQLSVNEVIVTIKGNDRPVKNLTVSNSGKFPLYVTVSIERVADLAAEPMVYEPADDLIVSPKTFSVAPLGQRTIRVLLKQLPKDKERAYRIVLAPQASEFGSDEGTKINQNGRSVALHVLTGAGVLVFAQPTKLVKDVAFTRDSKELTLINRGNIQLQFSSGVTCPTEVKLSNDDQEIALDSRKNSELTRLGCVRFNGGRVHAGSSISIPAPINSRIIFGKRFGTEGDIAPIVIDPNRAEGTVSGQQERETPA